MIRAFGVSDKGRVRSTNEDCFALREDMGLCVVADGMGGHNAGEVASRIAVDTVVSVCGDSLDPDGRRSAEEPEWPFGYDESLSGDGNLLRTAVHRANVSIHQTAITADRYAGMGTTLVAARVADGRLSVAHVGDSRLYLLADGQLRQLTRDDSWIACMLEQDPNVDPAVLMNHPMRNALTNVVGARARADVHVVEQPIAAGDLLLLTTDGIHGVLEEADLERLLLEQDDLSTIAKSVVTAALGAGSRDNCTAIVARYEP